ncbi:leptin b [Chanos chanos]|uniref:Leptin n=1 Tax=Chanos chanos TaxID=29144 RepID=A0A6J2WLI8_CHACN|nr:leptin-B-like [Chanos chanos]
MHSSQALLLVLVLGLVTLSASQPTITVNMIKTMARTTVARIKKIKDEHFQMSPEIDFGSNFDNPVEGLSSIIDHLSFLQARLKVPPTQHLRQVQGDVDTLLGHLQRLALSRGCPQPKPESYLHKVEAVFPITSNYICLLELQRYLEKVCLNLEKLKSC